jgi:hypothetical protein
MFSKRVWLKGSLCGAQFPKIVSGKSNNKGQNSLIYLLIFYTLFIKYYR